MSMRKYFSVCGLDVKDFRGTGDPRKSRKLELRLFWACGYTARYLSFKTIA